jgi:hypothetical protein
MATELLLAIKVVCTGDDVPWVAELVEKKLDVIPCRV